MKVTVIGTGHVGLVTCVTLSVLGHDVIGTDVDDDKISLLQEGIPPFYEEGLEEALASELGASRLRFVTDAEEALREAEVVFICVGTPARTDGEANLIAIERAARDIAHHGKDGVVVVEKSTVPAGTSERVRLTLNREGRGLRFDVASNPEFLREGTALADSLGPDRIVIGVQSGSARDALRRLYAPLTERGHELIETDIATAELAKHASNAFLAMKISFSNGLARICELAGADVIAVVDVMGSDPRIGRAFLNAGLGYGGACFPKDVAALDRLASRLGYDFQLLREVSRMNEEAVEAAVIKVHEAVWNMEGKRIGVLGLAFKPGTDDVRFSPALDLTRQLMQAGADVCGYDPQAGVSAGRELPGIRIAASAYEAAARAHCLVIATEWPEFRELDFERLRSDMAYPVIVDARNALDREVVAKAGFAYYPTGRTPVLAGHTPELTNLNEPVVATPTSGAA
jgi:UDPglucose 6-dehydrogenase